MTNQRKVLNDMLILGLHVLSEPQHSRLNHAMRRQRHGRHRKTRAHSSRIEKCDIQTKAMSFVKPLCDVTGK